MAVLIEGAPDPERGRREAHSQRLRALRATLRGRQASELTQAERDTLIRGLLDVLGWTDAAGQVD